MSNKVEKCQKCKSYLLKFPHKMLCPKCDNSEVLRVAKEYSDKYK